jgi:hypothetical protein
MLLSESLKLNCHVFKAGFISEGHEELSTTAKAKLIDQGKLNISLVIRVIPATSMNFGTIVNNEIMILLF